VTSGTAEIAGLLGDIAGTVYRIETGGSFLTGVDIDSRAQSPEGRRSLEQLVEATAGHVPIALASPGRGSSHHFYSVTSAFHGTEVVSPALLVVDPDWLLRECRTRPAPPGWSPTGARLDIYDFGVATVVVDWAPSGVLHGGLDAIQDAVSTLDAHTGRILAGICVEVTEVLQHAAQSHPLRRESWIGLRRDPGNDLLPSEGVLLWTWNHCRAVAPAGVGVGGVAEAIAGRICPNRPEVLQHRDHAYAAGVFASVTCSSPGAEPDAGTLSRAKALQDPWWTLFWGLDRVLLALLTDFDWEPRVAGARGVKARMLAIRDVSERVGLYRSRLESILVSSGARDIAAWRILATAWDLTFRVEVVDRKLGQLQAAYQYSVARLAEIRNVRVAIMVYVFTALSLVSAVVTTVQYAEAGVNSSLTVRLIVLGVSVLAAAAAVGASLWVRDSVVQARAGRDR
jgi:hypothetical protein